MAVAHDSEDLRFGFFVGHGGNEGDWRLRQRSKEGVDRTNLKYLTRLLEGSYCVRENE
jgi:hypothetical protein